MAIQLGSKPPAWRETVEEIMGIYRSLPRRPTIDEVQAAMVVIETVEDEERQRMEEISRMEEPEGVPKELFRVLQKMRRHLIMLRSHEQRKEALFLLKRDKIFEGFDQLIQKASDMLVSSEGHGIQVGGFVAHEIPVIKDERKKETGHEKAMSGVPTKEISDDNQKSVVSVDSVKPALVKDGDSFVLTAKETKVLHAHLKLTSPRGAVGITLQYFFCKNYLDGLTFSESLCRH